MKYIGNFKEWVNPDWCRAALSNRGYGRFKEGQQPDSEIMKKEYQRSIDAGYSINEIYFWMFDKNNIDIDITQPPFIKGKFHWWLTKMMPSNIMPMHIDPHTTYQKSTKRYWIPLQDYAPGHIFMYEDIVITNYVKGDVWVYENSNAMHGAANIGHTPRVVLQITSYDD